MKQSHNSPAKLKEAYKLAADIMKDRAASFYQAFRELPGERFAGVAALYAFCRYADDIVDMNFGSQNNSRIVKTLLRLERRLQGIYAKDEAFANPDLDEEPAWWPAFEDAVVRFNIPISSFMQQIEGQRRDAEFADLVTMEELIDYCRLVAGSVGTMMLPLLAAEGADTTNPGFIEACENLGIGMQITNILRDVGEDLRTRNRVYLPADLLSEHGIARTELVNLARQGKEPVIPEAFVLLWEKLAQLADVYYQGYQRWLVWFHPTCQVSLVSAALSYRAIADAVRDENYNCFTKRCYTTYLTRVSLIQRAKAFVKQCCVPV